MGAGAGGVGVGDGEGVGVGCGSCAIVTVWSAMCAWPVRAAPAFASTVMRTVVAPSPFAAEARCSHASSADADHLQPVSACSETSSVEPDAETVALAGETLNRHGAASCDTAMGEPLTSMAPCRGEGCALGSTRYETVPLPCPDADEVIAIQLASLAAAHVQSRVVVTSSVPDAPFDGTDVVVAPSETWHFGASGAVVEILVDPHAACSRVATAHARTAPNSRGRIADGVRQLQARCPIIGPS